ncbi:MAG: hypothetical protein ACFB15_06430 [Cyclobacteriaceae bacterium]
MNQHFNLTRFGLFLKYYWAENSRSYLISLGLVLGIMLLLMLPIVRSTHYNDMLFFLHALGWFGGVLLGGSLYTSTAFNAYASPERGVSTIMLPASRLEKFAAILLAHLFFVVLIYLVGYWLHDSLVALANQAIPNDMRLYSAAPYEVLLTLGFSYAILQGAVFLGSLYFPKNSLIKTLGILLVVVVLTFVFNLSLAYHFTGYPQNVMAFPFSPWNLFDGQRYLISYPSPISDVVKAFLGLVVVALVGITYVRLKEIEI